MSDGTTSEVIVPWTLGSSETTEVVVAMLVGVSCGLAKASEARKSGTNGVNFILTDAQIFFCDGTHQRPKKSTVQKSSTSKEVCQRIVEIITATEKEGAGPVLSDMSECLAQAFVVERSQVRRGD